MAEISEIRFADLCNGIRQDGDIILRHNPIGTRDETLLWMLLGCLVTYLSLSDQETPCFTGKPTAETYRDAIMFVLAGRTEGDFDAEPYIKTMLAK